MKWIYRAIYIGLLCYPITAIGLSLILGYIPNTLQTVVSGTLLFAAILKKEPKDPIHEIGRKEDGSK